MKYILASGEERHQIRLCGKCLRSCWHATCLCSDLITHGGGVFILVAFFVTAS